jgi:hypothetical protein
MRCNASLNDSERSGIRENSERPRREFAADGFARVAIRSVGGYVRSRDGTNSINPRILTNSATYFALLGANIMLRFALALAAALLIATTTSEASARWRGRAANTRAAAYGAPANYGSYGGPAAPGWAYSSYYGGPVYYYYANPNAMLPAAPVYPTLPSYGFTYSYLYPGTVYRYGWIGW